MTVHSGRKEIKDQRFDQDISKQNFSNKLFVRLIAKNKKFTEVNFMYGIFEFAYLRNCIFENCDFTGCRFVNCNLTGSSFSGCDFSYATFDKTQIDNDVLDRSCPDRENLKLKFARSLRINFQQLGDAKSANKAMNVELSATEEHLRKAWSSNDQYNRHKYTGLKRIRVFYEWVQFKILDFVWGNGESIYKIARAIFVILIGISIYDVFKFRDIDLFSSYWDAFLFSPQVLLGVNKVPYFTGGWLALLYFVRLIAIALIMSIAIKRFNRR